MTSVASGDSPDAASPARPMRNLDLALVGNGRIGALIDAEASIVWGCFPRFDGDPIFCALLDTAATPAAGGVWSLELVDGVASTQAYVDNTAVLVTRLTDRAGGVVEITDCMPRFMQHGRLHQPTTIARRIVRLAGSPRIVVRLRPAFAYSRTAPAVTTGSHHIRYVGPDFALRLTTDASLTAVLDERPFFVEDTITLLPRRRRPDPGAPARTRPPFHRGDDRVLARVGARPRDPVRVAGRRDPRGDHAEAQRLRRHRRDRRGDDHVDPRSRRTPGATGTIASAGCATPTSSSMR